MALHILLILCLGSARGIAAKRDKVLASQKLWKERHAGKKKQANNRKHAHSDAQGCLKRNAEVDLEWYPRGAATDL